MANHCGFYTAFTVGCAPRYQIGGDSSMTLPVFPGGGLIQVGKAQSTSGCAVSIFTRNRGSHPPLPRIRPLWPVARRRSFYACHVQRGGQWHPLQLRRFRKAFLLLTDAAPIAL